MPLTIEKFTFKINLIMKIQYAQVLSREATVVTKYFLIFICTLFREKVFFTIDVLIR